MPEKSAAFGLGVIAKYLRSPYHCPYCGSDRIEEGSRNGEQNEVAVLCLACSKRWKEHHRLVGITPLES